MAPTEAPLPAVRVTKNIAAPPERVFRAFLDPAAVAAWFVPEGGTWPRPPAVEPCAGGRYRYEVSAKGNTWVIYGTFLEVVPNTRLVFTWKWDDDPLHHDAGDSVVTIDFLARNGGTEVVLVHERLPNERSNRDHLDGWIDCLDKIATIASMVVATLAATPLAPGGGGEPAEEPRPAPPSARGS